MEVYYYAKIEKLHISTKTIFLFCKAPPYGGNSIKPPWFEGGKKNRGIYCAKYYGEGGRGEGMTNREYKWV